MKLTLQLLIGTTLITGSAYADRFQPFNRCCAEAYFKTNLQAMRSACVTLPTDKQVTCIAARWAALAGNSAALQYYGNSCGKVTSYDASESENCRTQVVQESDLDPKWKVIY